MSHGSLCRFCAGQAAFAKLDFLLDFALMVFEPPQCADLGIRHLRKQSFGLIKPAGLMRGFRLIAQCGKTGRQIAGKRQSIDLFPRDLPIGRDLKQSWRELLRRNLAPDHRFEEPRDKTDRAAVLCFDFRKLPDERLPLGIAER